MPIIQLKTIIYSEIQIVFDLSRSVDLHQKSASQTKEKVVAGVLTGLMDLEDEVTWEATHFGITQQLSSKITEYEYPNRFVDEMTKGFFNSFKHEHVFIQKENGLEMIDIFDYQLPFGIFGRLLDTLLMRKHLTDFLKIRNNTIKEYAESELWKSVLQTKKMDKVHTFDKSSIELKRPYSFPNPFTESPHLLADLAVKQCLKHLENSNNWIDYPEYINLKEHKRIGKMFGVLVVKDTKGQLGFITAFSGKLLGKNNYDYFIPPVFDMLEKEGHYCKEESELFALNTIINKDLERLNKLKANSEDYCKIKAIESQIIDIKKALNHKKDGSNLLKNNINKLNSEKNQLSIPTAIIELANVIKRNKKERQNKSKILQTWLFQQYEFLNNEGISKGLNAIFQNETIPSGAGECAAPKLLQFAYKNDLQPICLAEFWWGRSTNSKDKNQGEYYPPCSEKCKYILGHMLKGLID